MNRWDSPLFTVPWVDEKIDSEAIWDAVVGKETGAKIKANVATIIKPAREADYLHELDKATQEIVSLILEVQKNGMLGGELKVPDCKEVSDGLFLLVLRRRWTNLCVDCESPPDDGNATAVAEN